MTEDIDFHNFIEIHTIYVHLLFISLSAVSCFRHQYWFEIDTLPVHMQGFLFLIEFRN